MSGVSAAPTAPTDRKGFAPMSDRKLHPNRIAHDIAIATNARTMGTVAIMRTVTPGGPFIALLRNAQSAAHDVAYGPTLDQLQSEGRA